MINKNLAKKKISRFAALGLSLSLVLTSFAGSVQPVYAATQTESETSAGDIESTDDASVTAEADAAAEELNLIADEDTEGIYYNANSEMRDFRDETIYFVMTTRFYDGDSSNNVQCWDAQQLNENDPPWRGDFKGLIEKLDYIKALGFTAIWITPVVENATEMEDVTEDLEIVAVITAAIMASMGAEAPADGLNITSIKRRTGSKWKRSI